MRTTPSAGTRGLLIRLRAAARHEGGFSLVETVVAIGTIFASLVALAYTATAGFRYIGLSREQQAANQIADKLMEDARGLAFDRVEQGLSATDVVAEAADPNGNILDCGGVYRFQSCTPPDATTPPGVGETVIAKASDVVVEPLTPNHGTIGRTQGYPTDYTWHTYVTNEAPETQPYRVTVIVSWSVGTVSRQVQTQSKFSQAKGSATCDPSTHPFSAPCQPFFYGQAAVTQGSITVGAGTGVPAGFQSGSLSLTAAGSDLQQEQLIRVQGTLRQTGVSVTDATGTRSGSDGVASAADNDPSGQAPVYSHAPGTGTFVGTAFGPFSSGAGPTLTFGNTAGDEGESVSSAQGGVGGTCPPTQMGLPAETDNLGCGGSWVRQAGQLEATAAFGSGSLAGSQISVARVQGMGPPQMSSTFVDREPVAGQDGNLVATASRVLGDVGIGGFPSGITGPGGFTYLLRLQGYRDTATSSAGTNAPAPDAPDPSGTISFWNGTAYQSFSAAGGGTLPSAITATSSDGTVVVTLTPSETAVGAATSAVGAGSEGATEPAPNQATASVTAPLSGSYEYQVSVGGVIVLDVSITLDLGTVVARSSYAPAPGVVTSPTPSPSP